MSSSLNRRKPVKLSQIFTSRTEDQQHPPINWDNHPLLTSNRKYKDTNHQASKENHQVNLENHQVTFENHHLNGANQLDTEENGDLNNHFIEKNYLTDANLQLRYENDQLSDSNNSIYDANTQHTDSVSDENQQHFDSNHHLYEVYQQDSDSNQKDSDSNHQDSDSNQQESDSNQKDSDLNLPNTDSTHHTYAKNPELSNVDGRLRRLTANIDERIPIRFLHDSINWKFVFSLKSIPTSPERGRGDLERGQSIGGIPRRFWTRESLDVVDKRDSVEELHTILERIPTRFLKKNRLEQLEMDISYWNRLNK